MNVSPANRPHRIRHRLSRLAVCFVLAPLVALAQLTDFTAFSLEELSLVRISTLGRKQTALHDTPAAVYIVTGDDIHRTAALDFADALRMVPGLQVARINSFDYAITMRGFNDSTSNKLLVQMDGRSLYSTTASGTYWNYHELIMEDIERIEVLRGPGASLWGANAMNGVINIVSKDSQHTLGSMVAVAMGDELDTSVAVRHGWQAAEDVTARLYAKYQQHDSYGVNTGPAADGWNNQLVGTRVDWNKAGAGELTVIGEWRQTELSNRTLLPAFVPPYATLVPDEKRVTGGNFSAHYEQPVWDEGVLSLLGTYESYRSSEVTSEERRDTFSFDLQLTLPLGEKHEIIAGATYREDRDDLMGSEWITFSPESATTRFTGVFLQDEIELVPHRLRLTAGAKMERNSFSGWEFQPSLRAIWTPSEIHRFWAGISHAARTPTRTERGVDWLAAVVPPSAIVPYPVALYAAGGRTFDSEHVDAFELGYRFQPSVRLAFEVSLFHNEYQKLRGLEERPVQFLPTPAPHLGYEFAANNLIEGATKGGELSVRWEPNSQWILDGSVALLDYDLVSLSPVPGYIDPTISGLEGSSPRHETKLRIGWMPHDQWSFDLMARYVDGLEEHSTPAYGTVDVRIAWHPHPDWEFELVGRDINDDQHAESGGFFIQTAAQQISRSAFLRVTFRR
ncbi:TonB-dependent receptor plug domain-containing protein [Synoicihabitans lomoniglobus]|uniref:TonB-dependent receptor n=1 Tax=Synoicihabitans lomoniglobus TaxID=2909285 RepID=A0AAE9ZUD7_9BACT|nr:TonB-dependent receptor [Opitutaceae bacterium LMO-M01]WED63209.1 TonB-dependent receptor [Opitutaceae bacterium LMO-M01]